MNQEITIKVRERAATRDTKAGVDVEVLLDSTGLEKDNAAHAWVMLMLLRTMNMPSNELGPVHVHMMPQD